MRAFILRFTPVFWVAVVVVVWLALQQPRDDVIRRFLISDGCAPPCWQGIRPGETRIDEAALLLRDNPYIDQVNIGYSAQENSGIIRWRWRDLPPVEANGGGGYLYIFSNIVAEIEMETTIPLGDIWLLLGTPQVIDRVDLRGAAHRHYSLYHQGESAFWLPYDCPLSPFSFWRSPVHIRYIGETFGGYSLDAVAADQLLIDLCP